MSTFHFDPAAYGPAVAALLTPPRLADLGPGTPQLDAEPAIRSLKLPPACLAGLWLYFDFLDESHRISQADEGNPEQDFWHAVMHRREPDASNSKYWWRRVGNHPVLGLLREHASALGYSFTSPVAFVDFCERVRGSGSADEELAKRVQLLEWQLLFDWCHRRAVTS